MSENQNAEIEYQRNIIGSLILDNKQIPLVRHIMSSDDLPDGHYKELYKGIEELFDAQSAIDVLILSEKVPHVPASFIADCFAAVVSASNVGYYAKLVKKIATQRRLQVAAQNINEIAQDVTVESQELIERAQGEVLAVSESVGTDEKTDAQSVVQAYEVLEKEYQERMAAGQKIHGISTGYSKLDGAIDGIRKSHLWVIGGYTNTGKTAFSLNILGNAIRQGKRCVFFSLEMTSTDILGRLIGIMANTSMYKVRKAGGTPEELKEIQAAKDDFILAETEVYERENNLEAIVIEMQNQMMRKPVDLFFIDFLQLANVKDARGEYETTTVAITRLQNVAKQLQVPIIVLSQVSNEQAKNGSRQLMGFKGSGGIAAAADLAIELSAVEEPEVFERQQAAGEAVRLDCHVKKNRHGRRGSVDLDFLGSTGVMEQVDAI